MKLTSQSERAQRHTNDAYHRRVRGAALLAGAPHTQSEARVAVVHHTQQRAESHTGCTLAPVQRGMLQVCSQKREGERDRAREKTCLGGGVGRCFLLMPSSCSIRHISRGLTVNRLLRLARNSAVGESAILFQRTASPRPVSATGLANGAWEKECCSQTEMREKKRHAPTFSLEYPLSDTTRLSHCCFTQHTQRRCGGKKGIQNLSLSQQGQRGSKDPKHKGGKHGVCDEYR